MVEMQADDCLYLSTSNAARKYFTDALTVLAWPRGWVAHFRYQLQWVQEELAEQLPLRGATIENPLKGKRVVACYLFQTRLDAGRWKRHAIYPLRYGKVVEAYKVGVGQYDIAHFYFEVDGYAVPADSDSAARPPEDFLPPNYHAALGRMIGAPRSAVEDESACQALIESIRREHLTFQPDSEKLDLIEQAYPVVCFVRGVKERQRVIVPQFNHSDRRAYYELKEKHEYVLDCSFYMPSWCAAPAPGSKVSLEYDEKAFASAAKSQISMNRAMTSTPGSWCRPRQRRRYGGNSPCGPISRPQRGWKSPSMSPVKCGNSFRWSSSPSCLWRCGRAAGPSTSPQAVSV
jgi:hypothetical protein